MLGHGLSAYPLGRPHLLSRGHLAEHCDTLRVDHADDLPNAVRAAKQPHQFEGRAVRWMLIKAGSLLGHTKPLDVGIRCPQPVVPLSSDTVVEMREPRRYPTGSSAFCSKKSIRGAQRSISDAIAGSWSAPR